MFFWNSLCVEVFVEVVVHNAEKNLIRIEKGACHDKLGKKSSARVMIKGSCSNTFFFFLTKLLFVEL